MDPEFHFLLFMRGDRHLAGSTGLTDRMAMYQIGSHIELYYRSANFHSLIPEQLPVGASVVMSNGLDGIWCGHHVYYIWSPPGNGLQLKLQAGRPYDRHAIVGLLDIVRAGKRYATANEQPIGIFRADDIDGKNEKIVCSIGYTRYRYNL